MPSAVIRSRPIPRSLPAIAAVLALLLGASCASASTGVFSVQSGGYGHGIGMSQYGADGYALHGKSYAYILAHYYRGTQLGHTNPDQLVRVLLSSAGQPTFSGANRANGKRLHPGISYTVRPNADGTLTLLWHGFTKKHKPKLKQVGPFTAPLTVSGPVPLLFAGLGTYHGAFVFRPAGGDSVQTVESVALDDYVMGVVASEVPSSWPVEALKTQAVAARTYAITTDVSGNDYDLYPDTRSQAYGGVGAETPATDAAVQATRGQVVTYGGVPVVTYFSSSSGGHTESIQNVWPASSPEPWLVGVPDPYDSANGQNPYHRVVHVLSLAAAAAKLKGLFKGRFEGIRVLRHGLSPRVITAEVLGSRGSRQVSGTVLQRRFGLLTTWEVFTTLTSTPGGASGSDGSSGTAAPAVGAGADTQGISALVPLVDTLLVQAIPALHGQLVGAAPGARLTVELRQGHGWRVVAHPVTGPGGRYDAALPGGGTYRVLYRGLAAPPVTVTNP